MRLGLTRASSGFRGRASKRAPCEGARGCVGPALSFRSPVSSSAISLGCGAWWVGAAEHTRTASRPGVLWTSFGGRHRPGAPAQTFDEENDSGLVNTDDLLAFFCGRVEQAEDARFGLGVGNRRRFAFSVVAACRHRTAFGHVHCFFWCFFERNREGGGSEAFFEGARPSPGLRSPRGQGFGEATAAPTTGAVTDVLGIARTLNFEFTAAGAVAGFAFGFRSTTEGVGDHAFAACAWGAIGAGVTLIALVSLIALCAGRSRLACWAGGTCRTGGSRRAFGPTRAFLGLGRGARLAARVTGGGISAAEHGEDERDHGDREPCLAEGFARAIAEAVA